MDPSSISIVVQALIELRSEETGFCKEIKTCKERTGRRPKSHHKARSLNAKACLKSKTSAPMTKTGRWTKKEHTSFMTAMILYHGQGRKWIKVARMVKTRSAEQAKTHAQKYMRNLQKSIKSK